MTADLHLHTHYSDGNWSPAQVVEEAVRLGFKVIAITDHDTTGGLAEAMAAASERIRVIAGVEINTLWSDSSGAEHDVHILGYFIDPSSAGLRRVIEQQREARVLQIEKSVERFARQGFPLDVSMVQKLAGIGSVGRPHLAQAVLAAGAADSVESAYEMIMRKDSPYFVRRNSVSPFEAVRAINTAGGIASLAHPGKHHWVEELLAELVPEGLGALEAYHRGHSGQLVRRYLAMARRLGILVTGGSDCHGPYGEYKATIGAVKVPASVVRDLEGAVSAPMSEH